MVIPSRYVHLAQARQRFGPRADRLGALLLVADPLADEAAADLSGLPRDQREALLERSLRSLSAGPDPSGDGPGPGDDIPASLGRLLAAVSVPPFWADPARAQRGGAVFLRAGMLGGLVLGCSSLVGAYCSPGGNKPLIFSGRLVEDAPRRLAETGRFVHVVSQPGSLTTGSGEGFRAAVRVRLMHAAVRRLLLASGRWRTEDWGLPINQADMAATALLFSHGLADGLVKLGFGLTAQEREDLLHLWRCAGWIMGVREELLCATTAEAQALWELTQMTQGPPDDDSRALVRGLMESGETAARSDKERQRARRMRPLGYALTRALIGPAYASELRFPPDPLPWRLVVPTLRAVVRQGQRWARRLPYGTEVQRLLGDHYWASNTARGLSGLAAAFDLPEGLSGLSGPGEVPARHAG